jgi:hypothetical protein
VLFGAVLILDLGLLRVWRRATVPGVTAAVGPVAMAGFAVAVPSGACLLAANALEYQDNPFLLTKFVAIALGLVNALAIRRTAAWRARPTRELSSAETRLLAVMGGVSLLSWMTAVAAGRMIGYW